MKLNRTHVLLAFVAVLAVLAVAAVAGHPLLPAEAFAGLGALPFAGGTTIAEITELVKLQADSLDGWKKKQEDRLSSISDAVVDLAKKSGRQLSPGGLDTESSHDQVVMMYDLKSRQAVPVFEHKQRLSSLSRKDAESKTPSMGRVLRGIVLGGRADDAKALDDERKALGVSADPAGGYTVAGALSNEWIDSLRAQMVLSKAGCRTVSMPTGTLSLAKVTRDPTVAWHAENAPLGTGDPTFGAVTLNAKTAVCLVKMSLELSQDSANIEQILESTITSAMAGAIDRAGLLGVSADAAVSPGGIFDLDGRNSVAGIGAPTTWDFVTDGMYELMADDVPMESIGALIAHPALWKTMRKKWTNDGSSPLMAIPEVEALPKLWTTAAPLTGGTAKAVIADWRDLLFGVRKDIQVRVLQETFLGTNLQIAVLAYARVDFAATRAQSFCTLEDITVS